ncbi:carotenoid 1,2-hydratase [Vibrio sp. ZSDZ34]|uniref:Carotenoid 1,2-hydratase n=1 Tax=Vibrio gelatinilyticus TaxID=2893468 RepID=A0A9X1W8M0_9VIBR|nr:lipocalin-like domain-containing protein [Vibrio gelatinilyticus]MCJ2376382.1 carotenoid 1,2-hydratase [Vibrio gelatinilyticus]
MLRTFISALLILFVTACSEQEATTSFSRMLGTSDDQFESVEKGGLIVFPGDHQAHTGFRQEWWYLTANLVDEQGNEYGVQWTQFRVALDPTSSPSSTGWQGQQIYMAHSALTTDMIHLADEKWSREHPKMAGVTRQPLRVFLDDWQWNSTTDDLFPAKLNVASERFSYELALDSDSPYQKQGDRGYSEKSADGKVASYYYSQPFIKVSGTISLDGEVVSVSGSGWIDREWSSQFLLDSQQGWDWLAIRLSDEVSLVLFQLRDAKSGQANYAYGRLMSIDGTGVTIEQDQINLKATKQEKVEGRLYPTQWTLNIPAQNIEVTLSALNPKAKMPLSIPYWEGPIIIQGSHSGRGYMELTGY